MWYIGRFKNSGWYWCLTGITFLLVTGINIWLIQVPIRNHNAVSGMIFLLVAAVQECIPLMLIKLGYDESYKVADGRLITHKKGDKRTVEISEIKSLVVTGNFAGRTAEVLKNSRGVRCNCPLIELYLINLKSALAGVTLSRPMINGNLQKIGIVAKDEWCYRFIYNQNVLEGFLREYRGDVFIARTVYMNFQNEIDEIYSKWQYDKKQLTIIMDQNEEGNPLNSPYL